MNDPYSTNVVPSGCTRRLPTHARFAPGNNLLEVGDPQGNGPTFDDFPAVAIPIDGVTYHLQQLVLYQWFTENGWYTFPDPTSITTPATYCP